MKVAIVGSGPIAQGYAALLGSKGHQVSLWSPRGTLGPAGSLAVRCEGLAEGAATAEIIATPEALASAETVIFALRGNGHRAAFDAAAPHLGAKQKIIISSQSSMGGLYLSRLLAQRGIAPLIICWATTVIGGPIVDGCVKARMMRREMDVATIPAARVDEGVALSHELFDVGFAASTNLLAISLSNLNPPLHLANALLNYTRIENAEEWSNYGGITRAVSQLALGLDDERLALAAKLGVKVRSVTEHYYKSFKNLPPAAELWELSAAVAEQRKGTSPGPKDVGTRFITEDVPFGIAFIIALGKALGVPTPIHEAGLTLSNAIYQRDFAAENGLLGGLGLEDQGSEAANLLRKRAVDGWELASA